MAFIEIKNGKIHVDDSDLHDEPLIKLLCTSAEKWGFDTDLVSSGVNPSPDFGYFDLASRFWRASLCIYFAGTSRGFWESGAGFVEPWLFNARHSIELYLKGFMLCSIWFKDLQNDSLSSGHKIQIDNLKTKHELVNLYEEYTCKLKSLINSWNNEELSEPPKLNKMLLTKKGEGILKEIQDSDKNSFRYRYPSLVAKDKIHNLQELDWKHDNTQLFPITGLPKKAGYFFDHVKVINSLDELIKNLKSVVGYLNAYWDFIGENQDVKSYLMEHYSIEY